MLSCVSSRSNPITDPLWDRPVKLRSVLSSVSLLETARINHVCCDFKAAENNNKNKVTSESNKVFFFGDLLGNVRSGICQNDRYEIIVVMGHITRLQP